MKRLEDDYAVIRRKRPILSKEGTQNAVSYTHLDVYKRQHKHKLGYIK